MSIGQRIVYNNKIGTIRFAGEIPPLVGHFYGIDWDLPNDGKHDGTYKDKRYFQATYPTSGSFVKSCDVHFGWTFVEALKDNYQYDLEKENKLYENDFEELKQQMNVRVFQFLGFDQIRKLQGTLSKLPTATLASYHINGAGNPGEIEETCPELQDVDLSKNLMITWDQLAEITMQLKKLRYLFINDSRISVPKNPENYQTAFSNLNSLISCRTVYTWDDILIISKACPSLRVLKVPFNKITNLRKPDKELEQLTALDLEGNNIEDWSEVKNLGYLQRLDSLVVSNIGISEISIDPDLFPSLTSLNIRNNNILSWASIAQLNKLQNLKDLKIVGNPVLKNDTVASYRQKIIARIGKLKRLNGTDITTTERKGAEYDYLKEFVKEWKLSQENGEMRMKFTTEHLRYDELVNLHGAAEETRDMDLTIKSQLISIKLVRLNQDGTNGLTILKRLPKSIAIHKLLVIARKLLNLSSEQALLTLVSHQNPNIKVPLDEYQKALRSYGVSDGDLILVTEL